MNDIRKTPAGRLRDDILTPTTAIKFLAQAVIDGDAEAPAAMKQILENCDTLQVRVDQFIQDFHPEK